MISQLKPPNVKVLSLTTIASPHRGICTKPHLQKEDTDFTLTGTAFADYLIKFIGREKTILSFGVNQVADASQQRSYQSFTKS